MAKQSHNIAGGMAVRGFVNICEKTASGKTRLLVGTGTMGEGDDKTYKMSISVFIDQKFNGTIPSLNDYVVIGHADIVLGKNPAGENQLTMNVRFADQIKILERPVAGSKPAGAEPAAGSSVDDLAGDEI